MAAVRGDRLWVAGFGSGADMIALALAISAILALPFVLLALACWAIAARDIALDLPEAME